MHGSSRVDSGNIAWCHGSVCIQLLRSSLDSKTCIMCTCTSYVPSFWLGVHFIRNSCYICILRMCVWLWQYVGCSEATPVGEVQQEIRRAQNTCQSTCLLAMVQGWIFWSETFLRPRCFFFKDFLRAKSESKPSGALPKCIVVESSSWWVLGLSCGQNLYRQSFVRSVCFWRKHPTAILYAVSPFCITKCLPWPHLGNFSWDLQH